MFSLILIVCFRIIKCFLVLHAYHVLLETRFLCYCCFLVLFSPHGSVLTQTGVPHSNFLPFFFFFKAFCISKPAWFNTGLMFMLPTQLYFISQCLLKCSWIVSFCNSCLQMSPFPTRKENKQKGKKKRHKLFLNLSS